MKDLNSIISLLNLIGLGGVGAFLYWLYKGLTERINSLTQLANEQNKTLEAVRGRAEEFDKLSQSYKKAVTDFQEMGDKLETRRQELIKELEDQNTRKNDELTRLKTLELQEIELKEKSLNRLPELEQNLELAIKALKRQLVIVSPTLHDEWISSKSFKYESYFSNSICNSYFEKIPTTSLYVIGDRGAGKTTFINWLLSEKIRSALKDDDKDNESKNDDGDGNNK